MTRTVIKKSSMMLWEMLWLTFHFSWIDNRANSLFFKLYFHCLHCYRCPHFFPFDHLYPAPALTSLRLSPHCCLCMWVMHICFLANPFPFFHLVAGPPLLWQLSVCSMCPCLCFYFVHQFILFIKSMVFFPEFIMFCLQIINFSCLSDLTQKPRKKNIN